MTSVSVIETVQTDALEITLLSNHILEMRATVDEQQTISKEQVEGYYLEVRRLSKDAGRRCGTLGLTAMRFSPEARKYLSGVESSTVAVALMATSPWRKIIFSALLGIVKLKTKTKLFTKEQEAREWLIACINDPTCAPQHQGTTRTLKD